MTNHKWDKGGERCVNCGDKDWMGTSKCCPTPTQPNEDMPDGAINNLIHNQQQIDADGVMCVVSRQALHEVISYIGSIRADLSQPKEGVIKTDFKMVEKPLYGHTKEVYETTEQPKGDVGEDLHETCVALFCNPKGEPCMSGSDGDREILKTAMDLHLKNTNEKDRVMRDMKDALEFYADHNENWKKDLQSGQSNIVNDQGEKARQALAQYAKLGGE